MFSFVLIYDCKSNLIIIQAEIEIRCLEACAERDETRIMLQRYVSTIEEERVETNALRLRLQMLENQYGEVTKRFQHVSETLLCVFM